MLLFFQLDEIFKIKKIIVSLMDTDNNDDIVIFNAINEVINIVHDKLKLAREDVQKCLFQVAKDAKVLKQTMPQHSKILTQLEEIYLKDSENIPNFKQAINGLLDGWLVKALFFIEKTLQNEHKQFFNSYLYPEDKIIDCFKSIVDFIDNFPKNSMSSELDVLLNDLQKSIYKEEYEITENLYHSLWQNYILVAKLLMSIITGINYAFSTALHKYARDNKYALDTDQDIKPQLEKIAVQDPRLEKFLNLAETLNDLLNSLINESLDSADPDNQADVFQNIKYNEEAFVEAIEEAKDMSLIEYAAQHIGTWHADGLCAGFAQDNAEKSLPASALETYEDLNKRLFNNYTTIIELQNNQNQKLITIKNNKDNFTRIKIEVLNKKNNSLFITEDNESFVNVLTNNIYEIVSLLDKYGRYPNIQISLGNTDKLIGHAISFKFRREKNQDLICDVTDANLGVSEAKVNSLQDFSAWLQPLVNKYYSSYNFFNISLILYSTKVKLHEELLQKVQLLSYPRLKSTHKEANEQRKHFEQQKQLLNKLEEFIMGGENESIFMEATKIYDSISMQTKDETDKIIMLLFINQYNPFDKRKVIPLYNSAIKTAEELQKSDPHDNGWNFFLASLHIKNALAAAHNPGLKDYYYSVQKALEYIANIPNNDDNSHIITLANEIATAQNKNIPKLRQLSKNIDYTYNHWFIMDRLLLETKMETHVLPEKIKNVVSMVDEQITINAIFSQPVSHIKAKL